MKLTKDLYRNIIVDADTLGETYRLCGVRPTYEYVNNTRTDKIIGYAYDILCPNLNYAKLSVKISGEKKLDDSALDQRVTFENLKIGIYPTYSQSNFGISAINLKASATNIFVVKD